MSHPPSSYLTPETLQLALDLARELRAASDEIARLTTGANTIGAGGGGGREADVAVALRHWIGPHRDRFEQLVANEMESSRAAQRGLDEEADDWAAFWAQATNARRQRLYEGALADHRLALHAYDLEVDRFNEVAAVDPGAIVYLSLPPRPTPPSPPTMVTVPTAASNYQPTG